MKTLEKIREEAFILLVNSAAGIYGPQCLVSEYDIFQDQTHGMSKRNFEESLQILKKGPDSEFYCEAFEDVLLDGMIEIGNELYHIESIDGDICAVDSSLIQEWEYETGLNFWEEIA